MHQAKRLATTPYRPFFSALSEHTDAPPSDAGHGDWMYWGSALNAIRKVLGAQ